MTQPPSPQIFLELEQYEAIQKLAHDQGATVAAVTKEVVQLGLESLQKRAQQQKALSNLNQLREEIRQACGVYSGNLVEEARIERESQVQRTLNDFL